MSDTDALPSLTRCFAASCDPKHMTLVQIDRLVRSIENVMKTEPGRVDLFALDRLASDLDFARRRRRLSKSGHVVGQIDFEGLEVPY